MTMTASPNKSASKNCLSLLLEKLWRIEPDTKSPWGRITLSISVLYLALLVTALFAGYSVLKGNLTLAWFNADALWIEEFYRDLLIKQVDVSGWRFGGAPEFFPDMTLYFVLRLLISNIYSSFLVFSLVKIGLLFAAFYWLVRGVSRLATVQSIWLSLLATSLFLLGLTAVPADLSGNVGTIDFILMFNPAFHHGAITNILFAFAAMAHLLRNRLSRGQYQRLLMVLLILSTLAYASDKLYMVQFVAPAMGALFLLWLVKSIPRRQFLSISGVFLLAIILGSSLEKALISFRSVHSSFDSNRLRLGLESIGPFLGRIGKNVYYQSVLVSFLLLLAAAGWLLLMKWRSRNLPSPVVVKSTQNIAGMFVLFTAALVPFSTLSGMTASNYIGIRYMSAVGLTALAIWPFLLVYTEFGRKLFNKAVFHFGITILLGGSLLASMPLTAANTDPQWEYKALSECLDRQKDRFQLERGLGNYWETRIVNVFSQTGLQMAQVTGGELAPFHWANNMAVFEGRFDFVILEAPTNLSPIKQEPIKKVFGEPDYSFACAGLKVLVYKKPGEKGRIILAPGPHTIRQLQKGQIGQIVFTPGQSLATQVGEKKEGSFESTGRAGFLQFGPYLSIPSGRYKVEWHGKIHRGGNSSIGKVDLQYEQEGKTIVGPSMELEHFSAARRDSGTGLVALEFDLEQQGDKFEFRFFVNQGVRMAIDRVVLSRRD